MAGIEPAARPFSPWEKVSPKATDEGVLSMERLPQRSSGGADPSCGRGATPHPAASRPPSPARGEGTPLRLSRRPYCPLSEDLILKGRLLVEEGRKAGHTYSQPDLFIAGTALHHGLTVGTRDAREFERARVPVGKPVGLRSAQFCGYLLHETNYRFYRPAYYINITLCMPISCLLPTSLRDVPR